MKDLHAGVGGVLTGSLLLLLFPPQTVIFIGVVMTAMVVVAHLFFSWYRTLTD